jgi:hypothetical protein
MVSNGVAPLVPEIIFAESTALRPWLLNIALSGFADSTDFKIKD